MDKPTKITIHFNELIKVLLPMLLSFVTGRVITQTDLVMLAPLGEAATAAFGVPTRIMFIDIIAAFAIAPVVSVMVATAKTEQDRKIAIQGSLSFSAYLSVALVLIGLIVYPAIIQAVVKTDTVSIMSQEAVFWLTLAIPARLLQFVGAMALFGSGRGSCLIPIFGASIALNGLLNWAFIYQLELGFSGSYLSTFIVSYLEVIWTLWLLREDAPLKSVIRTPHFNWAINFINNTSAELGRLISWQVLWFIILMLLSSNVHWVPRLSAYSVAMEFYFFLMMPLMALMRSTAILLGSHTQLDGIQLYSSVRWIVLRGLLVIPAVSLVILITGSYMGKAIYHLNLEAMQWWNPFVLFTSIMLPIYFLNSIQRGIWQSRKKFKFIFLMEALSSWCILLPTIYFGLHRNNPWLFWGGLATMEIIIAAILFYSKRKLFIVEEKISLVYN